MTPLHYACKAGSRGTVAVLLQEVDPDALTTKGGIKIADDDGVDQPLGLLPVHWAFISGASEVVHLILSHEVTRWGFSGGYIEPPGTKYPGLARERNTPAAKSSSASIEISQKDSLSLSLTSTSEASVRAPTENAVVANDDPGKGMGVSGLGRTTSLPAPYTHLGEHENTVLSLQEIRALKQNLKAEVALTVARRRARAQLIERVKSAEQALHESELERRLIAAELERKRDEFVQSEWNAQEVTRLEVVVKDLSSEIEDLLCTQRETQSRLESARFDLAKETKNKDQLSSLNSKLDDDLSEARRRLVQLEDNLKELRGLLKAEIEAVGLAQKETSQWRTKHRNLAREVDLAYPLAAVATESQPQLRPKSAKSTRSKSFRATKRLHPKPGSNPVPRHWLSKTAHFDPFPGDPATEAQLAWEARALASALPEKYSPRASEEWALTETTVVPTLRGRGLTTRVH